VLIKATFPRRRVLRGAAAGALTALSGAFLTGCSADGGDHDTSGSPDETAALRHRAGKASAALLARYDATARAHTDLAGALQPLRDEVAAHVKALGAPRSRSSASPSPSRSPSAAPVPEDRGKAVAELASLEKRTADAHTALLGEAPGELARLLASVAAAGAAHAYLLSKEHQ
jgi:hypothetical protein